MASFVYYAFIIIALALQGPVWSIHWSTDTQHITVIKSCVHGDVIFPWLFLLDQGEDVEDIKWLYSPGGAAPDIIATDIYHQFIPVPTYAQRLNHLGNGSLQLSHATLQDSGEYTIEVSVHKGGAFNVIRHVISLVVAEPPSSSEGHLRAEQSQHAVYNNVTGQLHVQLTCGTLGSRGLPAVEPVWMTPSGQNESSSYSDGHGNFFLLLPNPVKGGNYSCRLPPDAAATLCLPGHSPLLRDATLAVDAVDARLTLLEGENSRLKGENAMLKQELDQTQTTLDATKSTMNKMETTLQTELNSTRSTLTATIANLENKDNALEMTLNATQATMQLQNHNILADLHSTKEELQLLKNKTSLRVSFYARKGNDERLNASRDHVKFTTVVTNEGNAYSSSTGIFTVPLSGTYFIAFSSGTRDSTTPSYSDLVVDSTDVSYARAGNIPTYYNQATGHAVMHLRQGQSVYVRVGSGTCFFDFEISMFSGFLITPD